MAKIGADVYIPWALEGVAVLTELIEIARSTGEVDGSHIAAMRLKLDSSNLYWESGPRAEAVGDLPAASGSGPEPESAA